MFFDYILTLWLFHTFIHLRYDSCQHFSQHSPNQSVIL